MDKTWWAFLEKLLDRALSLDSAERQGFLDQECGNDEALRAQLEALLRADEDAQDFLEKPLLATVAEAIAADNNDLDGDLAELKGYELGERLGEGGMGIVFHARQVGRLDRDVALKVMKTGLTDYENRARFRYECQSLARMNHVNIARIYDAGTTPTGRPYFSMERLHGMPITDYCRRHGLSRKQTIDLFMQVCRGVHHAHQQGIIHRDLKPSNIIVIEEDGQPVAKLIDFGIAVSDKGIDDAHHGLFGRIIGTPSYMSPEQAQPQLGIDTRTDIFCLGAVLYELLAGEAPFAGLTSEARSPAENLRERLQQWTIEPVLICGNDLDWILRKVLAGDKDGRYQSVTTLIEDLANYLAGRPVEAHPPRRRYLAARFVTRHKFGVVIAAALTALLLFSGLSLYLNSNRIRAMNRDLVKSKADLHAAFDFLDEMGSLAFGPESGNYQIQFVDVLRSSESEIARSFAGSPEPEARLRIFFGRAFSELGEYPKARPHLERALTLRRGKWGEEHEATLWAKRWLALLASRQGRYQEALNYNNQILAVAEKSKGLAPAEVAGVARPCRNLSALDLL